MVTTIAITGSDVVRYPQPHGFANGSSLLREAVEQAVAAGGNQVRLAAAARHVRRVPGALEHGVLSAATIDMPNRGAAEGTARPVVAGEIHVAGPGRAIHL